MISRMSTDEARSLLSDRRLGRLGCVYEGGPYVVPVNYLLDGENIYVHSLQGRKVSALRTNARACLQVDEVVDEYHWRSAIAFGVYREINAGPERDRVVGLLLARFPQLTPVESVPIHDGQSSVILFCIQVEEITGVAEK